MTRFWRHASAAALALAVLQACTSAQPAPKVDAEAALQMPSVLFWTPEQQVDRYWRMEEFYPTNVVRRGARVSDLPKASEELKLAWTHQNEAWDVDRYMRDTRAAGLLVIKDGRIVLERYGLGQTPDRRWISFSVAKSFSSTLVGAAIKDGKIRSVDDPITAYLPGLKGSAYEGVSIRQVLNMTSGVKWNEDYEDPNSDVARFGFERPVNGSDPVVAYMARLPREAEPGTKWVYKTGETNLIGSLVRAATGKPLADYLSEKIWKPVGMEKDAIWQLDLGGGEIAGCCFGATLRDYGRFALFFMDGAKVNGRSIVPDGWVADATRTTPEAQAGMQGRGGYGYQWWTTNGVQYRASGIFGQGVWINPQKRLIVVTQSAWPGATDNAAGAARQAMIDAVEAAFPS
jgi:CubicO group peptidase (beta-lactamase class C family)